MAMLKPLTARFSLIDHHGQPVTQASYAGRYMLVYFGFTHCRMICPRTLKKLSNVLAALGNRASEIVPLYVSIDPDRDTPEVMREFLSNSFPAFTGLTGSREQVEEAKRAFRVFSQVKPNADAPADYEVRHTAFTYLLDPAGEYVSHFVENVGEEELASRMRDLIVRPTQNDYQSDVNASAS